MTTSAAQLPIPGSITRFPHEAAAYAEYVTSPSRQLARTPDRLGDVATSTTS
jgi:hypothetical protein